MTSTHEGHLDIPGLPPAATLSHIVPEMTTHNLMSVGQLCDAGCTATMDKNTIQIEYDNQIVISGTRSDTTTLWHMDLPDEVEKTHMFPHSANAAIPTDSIANVIAFMHGAFFSPTTSTLEKAMKKGYIPKIPGFTAENLKKYPPRSAATIKGHLDQTRKNIKSTKKELTVDPEDELYPIQLTLKNDEPNYCYATVFHQTGKMYSDQTGNFIQPSSTGNLSIMVLYDYDSNAILAEPIKNHKAESMLAAYDKMHTYLVDRGMKPQLQILDNESSKLLKDYMKKKNMQYQLAPPGQHRTNAAERAIRTFKNHFIAGLCTTDTHFPIHLWDRLIEQAIITLNLMRGSRMNPLHSAWSQLNGAYDFNKSPFAPPGIHVLVHEKPDNRKTWDPHALDGWYLGPSLEHYRNYRVYIRKTQAERITDTLSWFPENLPLPTPTSEEIIVANLKDVVTELRSPTAPTYINDMSNKKKQELVQIATMLSKLIDETDEEVERLDNDTNTVPSPRVEESTSPRVIVETIQDNDDDNNNKRTVHFDTKLPTYYTYQHFTDDKVKGKPVTEATKEKYIRKPHYDKYSHKRVTRASSNFAYVIRHAPEYALFGNAINPDTNQPAEYLELSRCSEGAEWIEMASEEFGRLAQGNGTTIKEGTDTIRFIPRSEIPDGKTVTYLKMVVADRPEKAKPKRVRNTIGGDRIQYDGDCSTKAAELSTCKLFVNSVLSTKNARCMTGDLKDFYLQTAKMPEKDFAYMMVPLNVIPPDIIEKYKLLDIATDGKVYVEVSKGIYGLPQAGKLANEQLIRHLEPHGYAPCAMTPGLWRHKTRDITFLLVVDDFAIKYTDKKDAEHLLAALETGYKMSTDWNAERYCGLIMKWDYEARTCDVSMPGYIERALTRFNHPFPKKPQHNPFKFVQPEYGTTIQYEADADTSEKLDKKGQKRVQEVLGTMLYYARAVDPTLLVTVSSLARQQKDPTVNTMNAINHLLDYCATHPNAVTRFHASDMVLHVESDASYLSENDSKSRAAGYHYMSVDPKGENIPYPPINGAVLVTSKVIKETVSSAAEAELAALFHNGQDAYALRTALEEMGHPQPATPMQTDNSTAAGLANDTIKQKRSKAMSMRWFWIRDKTEANVFNVYWNQGKTNRADYFSKQHPTKHHIEMRSTYLQTETDTDTPNHFDKIIAEQANTAFANTARVAAQQQHISEECSKGVLIFTSGLYQMMTSQDPHSHVTQVTESAEPISEADRFSYVT